MCDDDRPRLRKTQKHSLIRKKKKVSPPEVGAAIMIIPQLMEKCNLDLSTVTQVCLSNGGRLKAASSFLASGQS